MFRLEYLKLMRHPQLQDLDLFFYVNTNSTNSLKPFTTVIIGPNGTGKSYLLRTIAEIFRELQRMKIEHKSDFKLTYDIHLKYHIDGDSYEINISKITNTNKKNYFFFKNKPDDTTEVANYVTDVLLKYKISVQELVLPQNILVNSVIPTDRFVWQDSKPSDFYQYLGIRSTKTTASTKSSSRRTIKYIFGATKEIANFKETLRELLNFLEFEDNLKVDYSTKINKLFFSGDLKESDFKKYFEEWWDEDFKFSKRKKENPLWSIPYYNNNFKDNLEAITTLINYLNKISNEPDRLTHKEKSPAKIFSINLFDENLSNEELEFIGHLEKLDIINLIGLKVNKKESNLSIEEISSGEYHLLISLIGIFSNITQNSLVLIDEPEISLHPNWQMRYIFFLKNVFTKFSSCHFILATHSHFIVSDLEKENSAIIGLERNHEKNKIIANVIKANTYGWSAEDILYNIFNVRSSLNYYLQADLTELLGIIANGIKDVEKIENIMIKLNKLPKRENDPLQEIIAEASEYLKSIK